LLGNQIGSYQGQEENQNRVFHIIGSIINVRGKILQISPQSVQPEIRLLKEGPQVLWFFSSNAI